MQQPLILDPGLADDAARLEELRTSGAVWRVDDLLDVQLCDLADTRSPDFDLGPEELDAAAEGILDGTPLDRWGRWVFYPWSGCLVHVLPPDEFRELRLDRNRYKVTHEEVDRLATIAVGIAGLSVGNAVALTLALEGSFGHLRLADHDRLNLSNMNRIRASVSDLGIPKTVLAARQIWELDPYASLSLFEDGVTPANVDAFLDGLDVVVDECDSLAVKLLIRERAKERGLPVLMETSDRGMLDVERFDLEPARPIFHGLVDGLTAVDLRHLDATGRRVAEQKAAVVLRLIDARMISTRLAASMLEIDSTVTGWPQLASDVTLGGASATIAIRRIALNLPLDSGRRYVDLERTISEPHAEIPLPAADAAPPAPLPQRGSARPQGHRDVSELARYLVANATLAPSGGNAQPWHFWWGEERLWVTHDELRSRNILDSRNHASWLALGAAVENAVIAAAARGLAARVEAFPREGVTAVVELEPGADDGLASLLPLVAARQTNRKLGRRVPLQEGWADALGAAAATHGATLQLLCDAAELEESGRVTGCADRIRFLCPATHREMIGELRWSVAEAEQSRDGVTVSSLDLPAGTLAALGLLRRPDVAAELRSSGLGKRLEDGSHRSFTAASAAGLLSVQADTPSAWLEGGRALQRFWLEATALRIAFQPMTVVLYLLDLLKGDSASVFTVTERDELAALGASLRDLFPSQPGVPALLFRLARVDEPAERSLRLPPEWVLSAGVPGTREAELV